MLFFCCTDHYWKVEIRMGFKILKSCKIINENGFHSQKISLLYCHFHELYPIVQCARRFLQAPAQSRFHPSKDVSDYKMYIFSNLEKVHINIYIYIYIYIACVCVCVYVCVRERERELKDWILLWKHILDYFKQ